MAAIREIEANVTLTEKEKARKRQELMSGKAAEEQEEEEDDDNDAKRKRKGKGKGKEKENGGDVLDVLDETFKCSFCMQLPERPVSVSSLFFFWVFFFF